MSNFVKMHQCAWIHPRCLLMKGLQLHKFIKTTRTESFHMVLQQNRKNPEDSAYTLVQKESISTILWCQSLKVYEIQAYKWQITNNLLKKTNKETNTPIRKPISIFFVATRYFIQWVTANSRLFSASFSCEFSHCEFSVIDSVLCCPKM